MRVVVGRRLVRRVFRRPLWNTEGSHTNTETSIMPTTNTMIDEEGADSERGLPKSGTSKARRLTPDNLALAVTATVDHER